MEIKFIKAKNKRGVKPMKCNNCHKLMNEYARDGSASSEESKRFYEYYCHNCNISIKKKDVTIENTKLCHHKWMYDAIIVGQASLDNPLSASFLVYHCEKCCEIHREKV